MPASVAYENFVVPMRLLADTLIVATATPLTSETQERLQFIMNRCVRGVIRSAEWIAVRQHELYDNQPDSGGGILRNVVLAGLAFVRWGQTDHQDVRLGRTGRLIGLDVRNSRPIIQTMRCGDGSQLFVNTIV